MSPSSTQQSPAQTKPSSDRLDLELELDQAFDDMERGELLALDLEELGRSAFKAG